MCNGAVSHAAPNDRAELDGGFALGEPPDAFQKGRHPEREPAQSERVSGITQDGQRVWSIAQEVDVGSPRASPLCRREKQDFSWSAGPT